jgi:hypothetical protein
MNRKKHGKKNGRRKNHANGRKKCPNNGPGGGRANGRTNAAERTAREGAPPHEQAAAVLCERLRENPVRHRLRKVCRLPDEQIDVLLQAPPVQEKLRSVLAAFVCEQYAGLVRALFEQAFRERPAAMKLLADGLGLENKLGTADASARAGELAANPLEQKVLQGVLEVLRDMGGTGRAAAGPFPGVAPLRSASEETLPTGAPDEHHEQPH